MIQDEFEVYLLSNGSMNVFPQNTLSHFSNQLSEPLQLDGDWMVALSEITYPTAIRNVTNGSIKYMVETTDDNSTNENAVANDWYDLEIPTGIYESVEAIFDKINENRPLAFHKILHSLDPQTQKIALDTTKGHNLVFPNKELPNIFGLENRSNHQSWVWVFKRQGEEEIIGDYPIDIMSGRHLMFVYIDLIDYQHVANTKAPMLRTILIKNRLKDSCLKNIHPIDHQKFGSLQYKKLLTNNISSIAVELRSENGEYLPFLGSGLVALTLKFKRV